MTTDCILTQNFFLKQLKSLSLLQIKIILGRARLNFSIKQLSFYLQQIYLHQTQQIHFKLLYKKLNYPYSYANFMKNIALCSKLMNSVFNTSNKYNNIKKSTLFNVVDTSLLPNKQSSSICQKNWDKQQVTSRTIKMSKYSKQKIKIYICGYKGLFFMNRQGFIYSASLKNINFADNEVTKNTYIYSILSPFEKQK